MPPISFSFSTNHIVPLTTFANLSKMKMTRVSSVSNTPKFLVATIKVGQEQWALPVTLVQRRLRQECWGKVKSWENVYCLTQAWLGKNTSALASRWWQSLPPLSSGWQSLNLVPVVTVYAGNTHHCFLPRGPRSFSLKMGPLQRLLPPRWTELQLFTLTQLYTSLQLHAAAPSSYQELPSSSLVLAQFFAGDLGNLDWQLDTPGNRQLLPSDRPWGVSVGIF